MFVDELLPRRFVSRFGRRKTIEQLARRGVARALRGALIEIARFDLDGDCTAVACHCDTVVVGDNLGRIHYLQIED